MVELVCGREQKINLEKISLSNDTVRCRISKLFSWYFRSGSRRNFSYR